MFDWVEEIKPSGSEHRMNRAQITAIMKHELPEGNSITVLGQFFCAPSALLTENSMLQLPAHTDELMEMIHSEISPHFQEVKAVYKDDQLICMVMQHLKPESKKLFHQCMELKTVFPIIPDLYREHHLKDDPDTPARNLIRYQVKSGLLEGIHYQGTDVFMKFCQLAFFHVKDPLVVCPTGWFFEPELRNSISLRFFASFASHLVVIVDSETRRIVALEIQ